MGELASKGQLRMGYIRWALVTVPVILFLGFLMGRISNSGFDNPWYDALIKPAIQPPGYAFPIAWSLLYILLGLALAMIIDARGAKQRRTALGLFALQMLLNFAWSPLFFAAHQVTLGFWLILAMLGVAVATTLIFGRIRKVAAWLMVPYLLWLSFAAILNYQTDVLNPDAEVLVPVSRTTTIRF